MAENTEDQTSPVPLVSRNGGDLKQMIEIVRMDDDERLQDWEYNNLGCESTNVPVV